MILLKTRGYPHGVMAKTLDCGIVVNEFELQSRYYVYFGTFTWERHEFFYPPSYGLNSTTTNRLIGLVGRVFAHCPGDLV